MVGVLPHSRNGVESERIVCREHNSDHNRGGTRNRGYYWPVGFLTMRTDYRRNAKLENDTAVDEHPTGDTTSPVDRFPSSFEGGG